MTKIRLTNRKTYNVHGLPDYVSPIHGAHNYDGTLPPYPYPFNNNNNNDTISGSSTLLYRTLSKHQSTNDEYIDSQFQKPPARVPTRSICLASFLCFAGISLLSFGFLVMAGHLDGKFTDRVWPMIIMGFLMFIPGAYHVRIAYYAYKGIPGYSFDDIPEFE